MERREQERCPACQGPAVADAKFPEGVKCRRSTCVHNHQDEVCPRCNKQDLDAVTYETDKYILTCKECTYIWSIPDRGAS